MSSRFTRSLFDELKAMAAMEEGADSVPHAMAAVEASLLRAIKDGDAVQVNAALLLGASPDARDKERDYTALMVAVGAHGNRRTDQVRDPYVPPH